MARELRIGQSPSPLVKSEGCQNWNQHPLYICTYLYVQRQSAFHHLQKLAVVCTWVYFLSFVVHAITQTIGMALKRSMQSPGKVTMCHIYGSLVALGNEESTSYLLGFRTANVQGGCRSSHLFFIINATCNNCACFVWDNQACILAIGTRVSKYASDLERSSLSTSTKRGAHQVTHSFPILESGSCTRIRGASVKYFFWCNSAPKTAEFFRLATTSSPQTLSSWFCTFYSAVNRSISITCMTNALSAIVFCVCGALA